MLDFMLELAVIVLPTLFAVGIEVTGEKAKKSRYWRWGVIGFGIALSALTAWQMSRASRKATAEQEAATERTAERVSSEAASRVTDALNRQYGTVIGGLYREIGSLEDKVQRQSNLRRQELALNYAPSIDIWYVSDQLQLWNRGKSNVTFWGLKYDGEKSTVGPPFVVAPATARYLLTDKLTPSILKDLGQNGEATVPLDIYISTADNQKYILRGELWEIVKEGKVEVRTQNHGFEKRDWSK